MFAFGDIEVLIHASMIKFDFEDFFGRFVADRGEVGGGDKLSLHIDSRGIFRCGMQVFCVLG